MAFLQEVRSALILLSEQYNVLSIENSADSSENLAVVTSKYDAVSEVWCYVKSGAWSNRPDFVTRVLYLTEHDRAEAIKTLGLSGNNHANTLLYRANQALETLFGKTLITDILAGNVEEAMLRFRLTSGTVLSGNLFVKEASSLLPEASGETPYKLADCLTEIKFLTFYSKVVLSKRFSSLDTQKLAYLSYLLSSYNTMLLPEQRLLLSILHGERQASEVTGYYNPINPIYDSATQKL